MVESLLLRWVLTVVFATTTVWCGFRTARPGGGLPERLSFASHLVMSALMLAMLWPWGMHIPMAPQIVLFTLATVWFAALVVLGVRCGHGRNAPRLAHTHHAVMAASMAWMVAAMPMLMAGGHGPSSGGHHHGLGAPASGVLAAGATPPGPPTAVLAVSAALAAFLVLSSVAWISTAVDTGRHALNAGTPADGPDGVHFALDAACHGAMSVGMGVMLFATL